MTVHERRRANRGTWSRRRSRLVVLAAGLGIAAAAGHGVAWADASPSESSGTSSATSSSGPAKPADSAGTGTAQSASPSAESTTESASKWAKQGASTTTPRPKTRVTKPADASHPVDAGSSPEAAKNTSTTEAPAEEKSAATATPKVAAVTTATTTALTPKVAAVTTATTSATTTPSPPGPLSPIAKLIALPGKIVNTLLQALDLTAAAGGPKSPLNFAPIDEMVFAAFRQVETALGLYKTPAVQPVLLTQTYTGPTDAPTPTVTQFLNAAAAEYVLGGTPGGLQAFTVNGTPLTSTSILSGESAQVWVTPDRQIIIAYQGTTGGTNLLFNPLIAISQVITDAQVILTNATPQAFTDSLTFEQQVQAAAALQGYDTGDIFLTGHSLGGWEAEYVAQQTGLGGIGFESPGINTITDGNGVNSGFVNVETYGDTAAYSATDLPGLQPFLPPYVPGGGIKPHYGSIVMIGDPNATTPLLNGSALINTSLIGDVIFVVDALGNFFEHHLPGMQAYNLGVTPDPGVVPWLGATMGPIDATYANMTISQLEQAASDAGTLITP